MKNVKILSVLFALVMLLSCVGVAVCAEDLSAETAASETVAAETSAEETAESEEIADTEESEEEGLRIEPMNFVYNLKYMGVGMFCIIVVIGVLIGVTMLLNKITAGKKQ